MYYVNVYDSLPPLAVESDVVPHTLQTTERKRKRQKNNHVDIENNYPDSDMDMATSPETPKISAKKKRKEPVKTASHASVSKSGVKKNQKAKEPTSPSSIRKTAQVKDSSISSGLTKGQACIRCKEKKIKCNQAQPACNQCLRGLWTCHYEHPRQKKTPQLPPKKTRSKTGCINCKNRRRKCTEEKPSCAYCLRLGEDCEYADYS
jgi:hypothetical protein